MHMDPHLSSVDKICLRRCFFDMLADAYFAGSQEQKNKTKITLMGLNKIGILCRFKALKIV